MSHQELMDLVSRRYKALSLSLHPDKVRLNINNIINTDKTRSIGTGTDQWIQMPEIEV